MSAAEPTPVPTRPRRSVWHWCRCGFRWFRITILAAVLLLLALLTWLRVVGLPDFLRLRLVDELARRGIAANFRSLHFHWFRGLVAEDLRVAWAGTNGTRVEIAEADLDLAPPLPWPMPDLIRGVAIRRGTLVLPLTLTNEPPLDLRLEDVSAELRFLPGDQWDVRRLSARLAGLQFELRAHLTNTAFLRRARAPADPATREQPMRILRAAVQELTTWIDASSARIELNLEIDGRDLAATRGELYLEVPTARTRHGDVNGLRFSLRSPTGEATNEPARALAVLELADLQTGRGGMSHLALRALLEGRNGSPIPTGASWQARFDHLYLRGFRARSVTLDGTTRLAIDSPTPTAFDFRSALAQTLLRGSAARVEIGTDLRGPRVLRKVAWDLELAGRLAVELPVRLGGSLTAGGWDGPKESAGPISLRLNLTSRADAETAPPDLSWWGQGWPYQGEVALDAIDVHTPKLQIERLGTELTWRPPELAIRRFEARLYRGDLQARGALHLLTRQAYLTALTSFDLHGLDGLLGRRSLANFARYQWADPPLFEGQAGLILPAWTNRTPDWDGAVKSTLRMDGRFRTGPGSFKQIPFDRAESTLSFDGANWRLPDLVTERPEGRQEIAIDYNENSQEYRIDARGRVLPPVLKPVLGSQSAEVVDLFEFRNAIDATVTVWGPWTEGTGQGIRGSLVATNFSFRGHRFDRLESAVDYTNRCLVAWPVHLTRDGGDLLAEGVRYDFAEDRLWLTNVVSTLDPLVTAAAISPGFPEKLAPYRFESPPQVQVSGTIQPKSPGTADLTFDIAGGPFEFWRLRADTIAARLHWLGNTLNLSDIQAGFFGGTLAGHARFDLEDPEDGHYEFEAHVREADLGDLLRHASTERANVTEGIVDLDLTVTSARTADLHSWQGFGHTELREGRLWDAPIFGFLSPILNGIVPGLGNNRARAAVATFTLTNSVIHTRDLLISCPPAKLLYRGSLDFERQVNAKVEAQVLGDVTGVGPLFGLILRPLTKLFEFRVTGTLSDIKTEPLYVPRFMLLPLQPLKVLRGIFGVGENNGETNASPERLEAPADPGSPP